MQDLHRGNLIQVGNDLQPIDVEIVFSKLVGPSQTILIPGPNITWERTALSLVASRPRNLSQSHLLDLIIGFHETLTFLREQKTKLINIIAPMIEKQNPEIRVIFRETRTYRERLPDLLREERLQLERGDIPYFFKFFGRRELFFYTSDKSSEIVLLPPKYDRIATNIGVGFSHLLADELEQTHICALLGLLSNFRLYFEDRREVKLSNGTITISDEDIVYRGKVGYRMKLS